MPKKQNKKSKFPRGNSFSNYSLNSNYSQYSSYYNSGHDYYDGNNSQYNSNYYRNYHNSFGTEDYCQNPHLNFVRYQQPMKNHRFNNQQMNYFDNRWRNLNCQVSQGYYQNSYTEYQNSHTDYHDSPENYCDSHGNNQNNEENNQNSREIVDDCVEFIPNQLDEGFVSKINLYRKVKSDSPVDGDFKLVLLL